MGEMEKFLTERWKNKIKSGVDESETARHSHGKQEKNPSALLITIFQPAQTDAGACSLGTLRKSKSWPLISDPKPKRGSHEKFQSIC